MTSTAPSDDQQRARKRRQRRSGILAAVLAPGAPALAQDEASQVVGAALGGFIGIALLVVIGAAVGWLASLIVKGRGSGFWGDMLFGIGGAMLAGYALPLLGLGVGGAVGGFLAALVGAIALIVVVRLVRKAAG